MMFLPAVYRTELAKELPEEKNILMECSIIERGPTGGDVCCK